jgi:hypothetical protein
MKSAREGFVAPKPPAAAPLAKPRRVQLSRAAGARLPPNTVIVSRPTRWGNPWRLQDVKFQHADGTPAPFDEAEARRQCVRNFEAALLNALDSVPFQIKDVVRELRGKNLACWCKTGELCHADVLLALANA